MIERVDELRVIRAIAHAGSLSGAARALGVEAKQVGRKLAQLETRLSVRLFHRTTRRLTITPEGRMLVDATGTILDELERIEGDLLGSRAQVAGVVRLGVPTFTGQLGLVGELRRVLDAEPKLEVQLFVADDPERMRDPSLDIALMTERPTNGAHTLVRLGTLQAVLAANRRYFAHRSRPRRPADLGSHECLRFLGQRSWTLIDASGRDIEVRVGGRFSCDASTTLLEALHAGLGIGLVEPRHLASHADTLVRVLPKHRFRTFDIHALVAPGRRTLPRVRTIIDVLKRVFTTSPMRHDRAG